MFLKNITCFFFAVLFCCAAYAQVADTTAVDSIKMAPPVPIIKKILADNIFINTVTAPVSMAVLPRNFFDKDIFFYLLAGLVLAFGVARAAYAKYFNNLFRVFFNSSLRQGQLTDQLQQDQLPSLIFNVLFVLCAGLYVYFLVQYYGLAAGGISWRNMILSISTVAIIYSVKFLVIRFTGWMTNYKQEAGTYIFIVFLINKIIGISLLPVITILAFSDNFLVNFFLIFSFALIGILLIMRFLRSYSLLQAKIKVSRFHFFLYIFSVEVLPLFIIYKAASLFLNRNL